MSDQKNQRKLIITHDPNPSKAHWPVVQKITVENGLPVLHITYLCPVCWYDKLHEDPMQDDGTIAATYEICPQCGTEFGYDNDNILFPGVTIESLRQKWIDGGSKWWATREEE
jgi:hypothetical protein